MFAAIDQFFLIVLFFIAILLAGIALLMYVASRPSRQRKTARKPETKSDQPIPWWVWLVLLVFILGWSTATVWIDYIAVQGAVRHFGSLSYASVEGAVLTSRVAESDSGDAITYDVDIEYAYRVGEQEFRGTRVRYYKLWGHSWVKEFVEQHPPRSPITVYYDSANPAEAVLLRDLDGGLFWMALFLVPFNLAMVGMLALPMILRQPSRRAPSFTVTVTRTQSRIDFGPARPWTFGLGAFFLLAFVSAACLGLCCPMPPSLPMAILAWIFVLSGTLLFFWRVAARKRAGKFDLVVDTAQRILTLPETVVGPGAPPLRFEDLLTVNVATVSEEDKTTYAAILCWRGENGEEKEAKVAEYVEKASADELVDWLHKKLGLKPRPNPA